MRLLRFKVSGIGVVDVTKDNIKGFVVSVTLEYPDCYSLLMLTDFGEYMVHEGNRDECYSKLNRIYAELDIEIVDIV